MKKILIILILSIFLIGCSPQIDTIPNTPETITSIVTVTSIVEDTEKIEELERKLKQAEEKNQKYYFLIDNLNDLLSNIYYGYAENDKGFSDGFTAFSLNYNNHYYLITAGHCIHYKDASNDYGLCKYFKFKANFSDEWIYPELITYENDWDKCNDYAIFRSDKIISGISAGEELEEHFILGHGETNIIRVNNIGGFGDSGSPLLNINGEVTHIINSSNFNWKTNINTVLRVIDNIK